MMQSPLKIYLLALATLSCSPPICHNAQATIMAAHSLADLRDRVSTILVGRVLKLETRFEDGRIWTDATIQVDFALKGTPGERCIVSTLGGEWNGIAQKAQGMAEFGLNERVLLFLNPHRKFLDRFQVQSGAQGKLLFTEQNLLVRDLKGFTAITPNGQLQEAANVMPERWAADALFRELGFPLDALETPALSSPILETPSHAAELTDPQR